MLTSLVDYLRAIYNPPVRGTRRVDRKAIKSTPYLNGSDNGKEALEALHVDEFERAYAVRWLTGLVSQASLLPSLLEDGSEDKNFPNAEDQVDALIHSATTLIAICAGASAVRTLTRLYAFYTPWPKADVDVDLTDVSISVNSDYATVRTQMWGSAYLMAEMLLEEPQKFGLTNAVLARVEGVRILELGAGTGLVSLAATKFLSGRRAGGCGRVRLPPWGAEQPGA